MNTNYHIDLVKKPTTSYQRSAADHELANLAVKLYPKAANAMTSVVSNGDWQTYCQDIEENDKFVWEQSHKGDKSNIFVISHKDTMVDKFQRTLQFQKVKNFSIMTKDD